jgi:hypothetical protein
VQPHNNDSVNNASRAEQPHLEGSEGRASGKHSGVGDHDDIVPFFEIRSQSFTSTLEVYFAEPGKVQPLRPPASPQATLTPRDCVLFDPVACKRTAVGHRALLTVRHTGDAGEPLAGVQARLFGADGAEAAPPQTTAERGFVFWVDLDPGEFDVRFDDDDAEAAA